MNIDEASQPLTWKSMGKSPGNDACRYSVAWPVTRRKPPKNLFQSRCKYGLCILKPPWLVGSVSPGMVPVVADALSIVEVLFSFVCVWIECLSDTRRSCTGNVGLVSKWLQQPSTFCWKLNITPINTLWCGNLPILVYLKGPFPLVTF